MARHSFSFLELFGIFSIFNWLFGSKKVVVVRKSSKDDAQGCCGCLVFLLIIGGISAIFSPSPKKSTSSSNHANNKTEKQQVVASTDEIYETQEQPVEEVNNTNPPQSPQEATAPSEPEGPSLRSRIMEDRETFKNSITKSSQSQDNKQPIWNEDMHFNNAITTLCGLAVGDDITRYFDNPSFTFKSEQISSFADDLIVVDFESSVNCLDSKVKSVILDKNLIIQGIRVSWPMESKEDSAYKFAEVRINLMRLLRLYRHEVDPRKYMYYCSTYANVNDEDLVIILKTDDNSLQLLLIATKMPINIFSKIEQADVKDNPICQNFLEKLKQAHPEQINGN